MDADEKELLESVERGEWKSAGGGKRERARFSRYAKATFKKDRRLNIRLSGCEADRECHVVLDCIRHAHGIGSGGTRTENRATGPSPHVLCGC